MRPSTRLPLCLVAAFAAPLLPAQPQLPENRPPVPFQQSRPHYPESLKVFRIRGEVRLAFDVDPDGYVQNLRALYATHPDFLQPALTVAQTWRFRPARKDGKPVAASREESVFSDVITPGAAPFSIPYTAPAELPEDYRYDRPPSIRTAVPVVYPYDLLIEGKRGGAEVAFIVGPSGRTHEVTVRLASHPDFGLALAAAMAAWEFEPAQKNGQPALALLTRGQEFSVDGEDRLVDEGTRRLLRILSSEKPDIVDLKDLDAVPEQRVTVQAVFPAKHADKDGRVEIEFIIDREGRVRLPRIVSATEPEFGWAAATAMVRWEFSPPLKGGVPVDARGLLQIEFQGKPTETAAAAEAPAAEATPPAPPP